MQDLRGGDWTAHVDTYLASDRGANTSAYARQQLYAQDGAALGFQPSRHGLDEIHALRGFLESIAPSNALAPLVGCAPFGGAAVLHELAHWKMTAGSRTS